MPERKTYICEICKRVIGREPTRCEVCGREILSDKITGIGEGYMCVYDKKEKKWRKTCHDCDRKSKNKNKDTG